MDNHPITTINIKDIPERKKSHEINLDNNLFVKDRKDKYTSNSINTFNSILIASYQKVNLQIFTPSSTVIFTSGKIFRKIVCVEPDHEKIKVLKERISKSEIRNRISILQNTIQNLRYAHSECNNNIYINITDSYVINHYECVINCT
ncbi:hypothetical protein H8356DRAFT_1268095 [Neocallimastix lanati (nom. inval.)]|nr:hypothetical protein H8356DRAFT_1268095 [Neocallimastix sp. JGI-2020a]